ncbi:MAG: nucleoside hydrolase [Terracidiphilus sp.]
MSSMPTAVLFLGFCCAAVASAAAQSAQPRYVIADQDAMGPGGSDMRALMVFLQAPGVKLLGITVVTGDGWRDEEVAHALRLLELLGRTDVKVYPGAVHPLWRTEEFTRNLESLYGKASFKGAWSDGPRRHASDVVPDLREGNPTTQPADEPAAEFMVRMVHRYPHQVTIFGAGPLTNIAMAVELDPHFAQLAQELVIMGGSIVPQTQDREWVNNPRHEFNFWFDPEAASIVLKAPWAKITDTTIDASLMTHIAPEILDAVFKSGNPAARYLRAYIHIPVQGVGQYAWDELAAAAWLDPAIVKTERLVYMDVNTDRGANYGDTLTWQEELKPSIPLNKVHAIMEPVLPRLQEVLIRLFSAPTPGAIDPQMPPVPSGQ